MKLTREQRHLVYKTLLKVVCKDPSILHGMCWYLFDLLNNNKTLPDWWRYSTGSTRMKYLPELNKYKSSKIYWAPLTAEGWETRIGWIEQAIKDTK